MKAPFLPAYAANIRAAQALVPSREGVTAIEFALLLPFFALLVVGIIDFGEAIFFQLALQHAVTEAARCATVSSQTGDLPNCTTAGNVEAYAVTEAYGLNVPAGTFSETTPAGYTCVAARYPFSFTLPLGPSFPLTLTASSCYPT